MAFVKRPCDFAAHAAPSPASASASASASVWVLVVAIAGSSMSFIDATAVNVALPSIQHDLQSTAAELQWVVEGYSLFLSALILIGGSLGDRFGRRRVFVWGVGLFACASIGCAAAQTILELNLARCVAGIGGALATPGSLALISANFSGAERGRAIGTWSAFASITAALGPLLGGWLAEHASWRDVFLINIPIALFVIAAALARVPESRDDTLRGGLDVVGAILATVALGAVTLGLIRLQSGTGAGGSLSVVCGGVLLVVFAVWERRAAAPMVPLDIFTNAAFSAANAYTFVLYAALGGSLFFVPFDLVNVQGYSPTAAGAAMLPFIAIMFVLSRWSGGLVATLGPRIPLVGGAVLAAVGFAAYARTGLDQPYWTSFFPAAVLLGAGAALFVAPLTTTVMGSAPARHAGAASGINNAVSRVAALLAIAALGIVLTATLLTQFDRAAAALPLSAQTRTALVQQRDSLATGKRIAGVSRADAPRVDALIRTSFTQGFARVMIVSALLSGVAALLAFFAFPAQRTAAAAPAEAARTGV